MSTIGLSYTDSTATEHTATISLFLGEDLPRSYLQQAKLEFSTSGVAIAGGPSRSQRRIWAISCLLTDSMASSVDSLFRAWDTDRAKGLAAAVAITDSTTSSDVISAGWFSTPPKISQAGPQWVVSFGLTEV